MKFVVPASMYTLPMMNNTKFVLPLLLTLTGLFFPEKYLTKYVVAPAVAVDVSTLTIEGMLTNQGVLPFWFLNGKYVIHFFDILSMAIIYKALSRQKTQMDEKPQLFI